MLRVQDAADAILAALEDGYNRLEVDFPFGPSDSAPPSKLLKVAGMLEMSHHVPQLRAFIWCRLQRRIGHVHRHKCAAGHRSSTAGLQLPLSLNRYVTTGTLSGSLCTAKQLVRSDHRIAAFAAQPEGRLAGAHPGAGSDGVQQVLQAVSAHQPIPVASQLPIASQSPMPDISRGQDEQSKHG